MKKMFITVSLLFISLTALAQQQCLHSMALSAPNTRFDYSNQGIVKDKLTGLTWMRCAVGQQWDADLDRCLGDATLENWQGALQTAQAVDDPNANHPLYQFAGKQGWRMPNIKELVSLSEMACYSPSMNDRVWGSAYDVEPGDLAGYIWSNTPSTQEASALSFDSVNGEVIHHSHNFAFSMLMVTEQ